MHEERNSVQSVYIGRITLVFSHTESKEEINNTNEYIVVTLNARTSSSAHGRGCLDILLLKRSIAFLLIVEFVL